MGNKKNGKISLTPGFATILTKIKFAQQNYATFSKFHTNRPGKIENNAVLQPTNE
jgi:hypothetical protein